MNRTHNPRLTANARTLRKAMTEEERHLWYVFLKKLPVSFHRQKVIGNYIVDFYCSDLKLVIELDGSRHYDEEGKKSDAKRDEYLQGLGLTVKRYSNADVNERFASVCEDIHQYLLMNK